MTLPDRASAPTFRPSRGRVVSATLGAAILVGSVVLAIAMPERFGIMDRVTCVLIGGGVAANSRLREMARQRCEEAGVALRVPRRSLCTDNGAMVASLGAQLMLKGRPPSDPSLPADSSLPVTDVRTGLPVEVDHDH